MMPQVFGPEVLHGIMRSGKRARERSAAGMAPALCRMACVCLFDTRTHAPFWHVWLADWAAPTGACHSARLPRLPRLVLSLRGIQPGAGNFLRNANTQRLSAPLSTTDRRVRTQDAGSEELATSRVAALLRCSSGRRGSPGGPGGPNWPMKRPGP